MKTNTMKSRFDIKIVDLNRSPKASKTNLDIRIDQVESRRAEFLKNYAEREKLEIERLDRNGKFAMIMFACAVVAGLSIKLAMIFL